MLCQLSPNVRFILGGRGRVDVESRVECRKAGLGVGCVLLGLPGLVVFKHEHLNVLVNLIPTISELTKYLDVFYTLTSQRKALLEVQAKMFIARSEYGQ